MKKGETRRSLSTAEARKDFSELISRTSYAKERTVIRRNNKNLAVMIPYEDLALLERIEDHIDLKEALLAKTEIKKFGTDSL